MTRCIYEEFTLGCSSLPGLHSNGRAKGLSFSLVSFPCTKTLNTASLLCMSLRCIPCSEACRHSQTYVLPLQACMQQGIAYLLNFSEMSRPAQTLTLARPQLGVNQHKVRFFACRTHGMPHYWQAYCFACIVLGRVSCARPRQPAEEGNKQQTDLCNVSNVVNDTMRKPRR